MSRLYSAEVKEVLLSAHIIVGWCLLVAGAIAVAARKGARVHRVAGTVFFALLILTVVLSVALEVRLRWLPWTFSLAASALCCLFAGYVAARKRNRWPGRLGGALVVITAAMGIVFIFTPGLHGSQLRPTVLGLSLLVLAGLDAKAWHRHPHPPRYWWFIHLRHMLAAFAFALTAFAGATMNKLPVAVWKWWPFLLGLVAIVGFSRHYQKKFAPEPIDRDRDERAPPLHRAE